MQVLVRSLLTTRTGQAAKQTTQRPEMKLKLTHPLGMMFCGTLIAGWLTVAEALPITAQLTGDPRPANPDNLIVDVTISQIDLDTVKWVFDINSPSHPNIKLDEFYFNLVGSSSDFQFYGFDPTGWAISSPASTAGGGGVSFLFEAKDPPGPPNAADVTNTQNLTFFMDYLAGSISDSLFLAAPKGCSNDQVLGCGQLGAHLQSLVASGGQSDSGFVLGNYVSNGGGGRGTIPEPGSIGLAAITLAALAATTRRRKRSISTAA